MRRLHPGVPDVLYAMATTTALAGVLVGMRAWWLTPALVAAALAPFFEWWPVPVRAARVLLVAMRLVLLLAFAAVWFTRPMPLVADHDSRWVPPVLASLLAALAGVFAVSRRTIAAGRALVPTLLGMMVVAGADPSPRGFGASVVPAFRAAGHNAFAELYLLLAVLVTIALWAATLAASGPAWAGRPRVPLALTLVVAAALAALGVLGLPLAQPHVERAMAEAMVKASTGLARGATLGEFGELAVSRRRVLDLRASDPVGQWRLRAEVLTTFDGRRWTAADASEARPVVLTGRAAPLLDDPLLADLGPWFTTGAGRPDGTRMRITQHVVDSWPLLLPRGVAAVSAATPLLELDSHGLVQRLRSNPVPLYGAALASRPAPSPPLSAREAEVALALPPRVDPRVRALAANLGAGSGSPAEAVARTVEHLQTEYRYTLSPGPFRPQGDPVAEFLFEKKQGYCEYFATAAVLLLRLQGIPARFVKGLSVGMHNNNGDGLFVVRESDAHAWAEAWIAGSGWIEIDPTPARDFAAAHVPPGSWEQLLERARAVAAEAWARLTGPGLAGFGRWLLAAASLAGARLLHGPVPLGVVAAAGLAFAFRRRLRAWYERWRTRRELRAHSPLPRELVLAVEDLEARWKAVGQPRPPSRGLREHARSLSAGRGSTPSAAAHASALALVDLYYGARFGGETPEQATIRELRAAIRG